MITKNEFNVQCITPSEANLIYNIRIGLRRVLVWTRAFILGSYTGLGTAEELFGRFYLESTGFAELICAFFGRRNSEKYSNLLTQFSIGIRDLVTAQLSGNNEAIMENVNRLYQNIEDRAAFLASLNPYFNAMEWRTMQETYLQYLLEAANAFTSGNYSNEIEIFDRLLDLTNNLGDYFAQSLYYYITSGSQNANNLPPQSGQQCLTYEQMNDIFTIRTMWFNLVIWIRNFMLSKYLRFGNVDQVYARLSRIPAEFINALRDFFGDNPILNDYQMQLNELVDLIDSFTSAQMEGNTEELQRITQLLYQNANDRANSLASLNPYWNQSEIRSLLNNNITGTLQQSTTFLTGNYAANTDIYSTLLLQAEDISELIAQGLISYINSQANV